MNELKEMGVQEMNVQEMKDENGGLVGLGPLWWNSMIRASSLRYHLYYNQDQFSTLEWC